MLWKSSTSSPSGVAISMALAMRHRLRQRRRRLHARDRRLSRPHHQPLHRHAGLQAQLRGDDVGLEPGGRQLRLDIVAAGARSARG